MSEQVGLHRLPLFRNPEIGPLHYTVRNPSAQTSPARSKRILPFFPSAVDTSHARRNDSVIVTRQGGEVEEEGTNEAYEIESKAAATFYFIGVTTAKSSSMKVFPAWMREIGRTDVTIEGVDCRIHDDPQVYRRVVAQIKGDPRSVGGLVTTHKIDLLAAARDMFDYLDPYAQQTGEVSSISKRDGRLEGHAKDPITVGSSLDAIVPRGYFGRTGAEVLIFGAGGSSTATVLNLANRSDPADRPRRILVVNRSRHRLEALAAMAARQPHLFDVEYIENADPKLNDEIMGRLSEHSLVINATGMGKDIPGSPVSDEGLFPRGGIAWEFNYRGELPFLHQAERQREERELTVEDGWVYFVHGWAEVVAQVLHFDMTPDLFERFARSAAEAVGRAGTGSGQR